MALVVDMVVLGRWKEGGKRKQLGRQTASVLSQQALSPSEGKSHHGTSGDLDEFYDSKLVLSKSLKAL